MEIFCWMHEKHYYFLFEKKDNGDIIFKIYIISDSASWGLFSYLFRLYLFLHKLLKVWSKSKYQSFYLFFLSAWHSLVLCLWSWWKKQNLLGFLVFEPPFIGGGCCIKSFPFMVINTSARVVVRGVVRSPRNIKRSCMFPLVED